MTRNQKQQRIAPFGMSLTQERENKYLLTNMSTTATYDHNKAYQKTVMPRIPTKVQMAKV